MMLEEQRQSTTRVPEVEMPVAQRTVASTTTSVIAVGRPLMVNNARRLSNVIGGEKGINGVV